jgi:hypothetical protein
VRTTVIALLGMLAAACATSAAPRDSLDLVATDFVRLALELGERDPGFVDAITARRNWRPRPRRRRATCQRCAAGPIH